MPDLRVDSSASSPDSVTGVGFRQPTLDDGAAMWRMARDSQVLDVNTSYAYLLWARDFAATSVVALDNDADNDADSSDGAPCGFVSGYRRPDQPDTLMVWQVAVDSSQRGRGIAKKMLDWLFDHDPEVSVMETTITEDNAASIALFSSFAQARGMSFDRSPLFEASDFPDDPEHPEGHDAELLFRMAPR